MTASVVTTYLVTGAARGIGRSIVDILSARDNVRVVAGVRDAKHANAQALSNKANVTVVEMDSARVESIGAAVQQIQADGIQAVDVVFANAGMNCSPLRVADTSADELRTILAVNTVAPIALFQALKPLLQKSQHPRFFVTSSSAASFAIQTDVFAMEPKPQFGAYSISKAALNMAMLRIALEEPWLVAVALHPGLVATDMPTAAFGEDMIKSAIESGAALTPEKSAAGIVKLSEDAKHDSHSGRFFDVQQGDFMQF